MWWKVAKNEINDDLFEKIKSYTPVGPKDGDYKKYQIINFLETNCGEIEIDQMEQYSFYLSKLYKWMLTMIEHRKEDILKRREIKEKLREEREQLETEYKEREDLKAVKKTEAIEEFEAKVDEEMAARKAEKEAKKAAEGEGEGEGEGAEGDQEGEDEEEE